MCIRDRVKTANQSFKFGPKLFATLAELNSWVGDFSQGKGTDGETLYKLCPRSCSPDYKYSIRKDNSGRFLVSVSYTHLRAHETVLDLVCRLLLEKKKKNKKDNKKKKYLKNSNN